MYFGLQTIHFKESSKGYTLAEENWLGTLAHTRMRGSDAHTLYQEAPLSTHTLKDPYLRHNALRLGFPGNVCWPITSQVSRNRTSSCKDPALTCAAFRKGHTTTRLQSVGKLQAFEGAGWAPQIQEHVFQHPLPALPMTRAWAAKITFGCRGRRTKGDLGKTRDSSHSEHGCCAKVNRMEPHQRAKENKGHSTGKTTRTCWGWKSVL